MLESSLIESKHGNSSWTVSISIVMHVLTVGVLLLIPLIYTSALPMPEWSARVLAPTARIDTTELVPALRQERLIRRVVQVDPTDLVAPTTIPRQIVTIDEVPTTAMQFSSSSAGVVSSILRSAMPDETSVQPPAPPPPPAAPQAPPAPIRVSVGAQQAHLVEEVLPVYPPLAKAARVQGIVVLEAVIAKDGSVQNLRVVSGHQLLIQASIDAVSRWRYQPTLLNNEPVEVITTVTVTFRLNQ
jgi:periplasmic protein TonB